MPKIREAITGDALLAALIEPTLRALEASMEQLAAYDRAVMKHARGDETVRLLMTAPGVGPVVALAYITGVEDPARFSSSASVGAYFGMTPRRYQSGEIDYDGGISKSGDTMLRTMLYEAAQILLVRTVKWSWLKAWAMQIARRRGMKKAIVALARRLAVIMHRMWVDGTEFRWTRETAVA